MKQQLLGTLSPTDFFAAFFFAIVGLAVSLLIQANNRDIKADSTPFHFDYKFLFLDNWKRILLSILMICICIRFYTEIFDKPITMWLALCIGLGLDKISQILKDKIGMIQVNRDAIKP